MRLVVPFLMLTGLGCSQPASAPERVSDPAKPDLSAWHVAGEEDGLLLAWRPRDGEVPRNQEFELAVMLFEGGVLIPGARVGVRGWMPDHQHGLVKTPQVVDANDGSYRVEGLLLHMRGSWQLIFDVTRGTTKTSFPFQLEL